MAALVDSTMSDLNEGIADLNATASILGHAIAAWNRVELETKSLLTQLSGANPVAFIAIHRLTCEQLVESLKCLAVMYDNSVLRQHLEHVGELVDRLRLYRNHYVHGITFIGFQIGDPTAHAAVWSVQTRNKPQLCQDRLGRNEVEAFHGWCCESWGYLLELKSKAPVFIDFVTDGAVTLPPMPPLPERLSKRGKYVIAPEDIFAK